MDDAVKNFAEKAGIKYNEATNKYKIKMTFILTDEEELEVCCKILKVDETLNCIQFTKISGDSLVFYEKFKAIEGFLHELNVII